MKKSATKVLGRIKYLLSCLAGRSNFRARRPQRHRFDGSRVLHPAGGGTARLAWIPLRSDRQSNRSGSRP
jgi:hypothetical protein